MDEAGMGASAGAGVGAGVGSHTGCPGEGFNNAARSSGEDGSALIFCDIHTHQCLTIPNANSEVETHIWRTDWMGGCAQEGLHRRGLGQL